MTLENGRDPAAEREHEAFADWDAAYVLGALTPADRSAYQDHLAGCERCRAAVAELAPLPGLLARAPRAALDDEPRHDERGHDEPRRRDEPGYDEPRERGADDEPEPVEPVTPPADLVDLVVRRDARRRTRRRLVAAGIAAALVVGAAVAVSLVVRGPEPAETVALARQVDTSLTASVALTPVAWGTKLSMDCDYPAGASPYTPPAVGGGAPVYALVVTDVDGEESQVSTWSAEPGRDVRLDAATAVPLDRIASLEIRSAGGRTLLAADLAGG